MQVFFPMRLQNHMLGTMHREHFDQLFVCKYIFTDHGTFSYSAGASRNRTRPAVTGELRTIADELSAVIPSKISSCVLLQMLTKCVYINHSSVK